MKFINKFLPGGHVQTVIALPEVEVKPDYPRLSKESDYMSEEEMRQAFSTPQEYIDAAIMRPLLNLYHTDYDKFKLEWEKMYPNSTVEGRQATKDLQDLNRITASINDTRNAWGKVGSGIMAGIALGPMGTASITANGLTALGTKFPLVVKGVNTALSGMGLYKLASEEGVRKTGRLFDEDKGNLLGDARGWSLDFNNPEGTLLDPNGNRGWLGSFGGDLLDASMLSWLLPKTPTAIVLSATKAINRPTIGREGLTKTLTITLPNGVLNARPERIEELLNSTNKRLIGWRAEGLPKPDLEKAIQLAQNKAKLEYRLGLDPRTGNASIRQLDIWDVDPEVALAYLKTMEGLLKKGDRFALMRDTDYSTSSSKWWADNVAKWIRRGYGRAIIPLRGGMMESNSLGAPIISNGKVVKRLKIPKGLPSLAFGPTPSYYISPNGTKDYLNNVYKILERDYPDYYGKILSGEESFIPEGFKLANEEELTKFILLPYLNIIDAMHSRGFSDFTLELPRIDKFVRGKHPVTKRPLYQARIYYPKTDFELKYGGKFKKQLISRSI